MSTFLFGMFLFFSEWSFLNQIKLIWSLNQDEFYHLVPFIEYKSVEFGNVRYNYTKFELKCSLNVSLLLIQPHSNIVKSTQNTLE